MRTKIIAAAMFFLIVGITSVNAQRGFDIKERVNALKERLKLNDDQTKKVEAIYEEMRAEMEKARNNSSGDRETMMSEMMKLREKTNTKIEEILTDEQKTEYKKYLEERRKEMQNRGRGRF